MRETLLNALAILNEESGAHVDLYYAGDAGDVPFIPNALTVRFQDIRECCPTQPCPDGVVNNNPLGQASSWNCGSEGSGVAIFLKNCDGTVRDWRTSFSPGLGIMFEGVLVHEIVHAVWGILHTDAGGSSVMIPAYVQDTHNAFRHLFTIDANTIELRSGLSSRVASYTTSTTGVSWSAPQLVTSHYPERFTTVGPAIARRATLPGQSSGEVLVAWPNMDVRAWRARFGVPGSGGAFTPPASYPSNAAGRRLPVAVSYSAYGEVAVAAVGPCGAGSVHCPIHTAWSSNLGGSWVQSSIEAGFGTITRPVLEYDGYRDRFVLFFIRASDGYLYSTWRAAAPGGWWQSPVLASSHRRYRFLGGAVFHPSGAPNLLTAAQDDPDIATMHRMVQLAVNVTGGGSTYTLGSPGNLGSAFQNYRTRRPFGMAYDAGTDRTRIVWRGNNASRALFSTDRVGTGTGFFGSPVELMPNAVNSVDLTRTSSSWVATLSAL
ncbi:MAG: hypothetical protein KF729_10780 [Sandaracinaceae bacterium]|nr:hypothetical protein [Sandaracinaceae bacterium]